MKMRQALTLAALLAALLAAAGTSANADVIAGIKAKGEIVIAVKEADPPFGFRNGEGELTGLEIDLARSIAERLGVQLKLFPVNAVSRLQFLEIRTADAVLATLAVSDHRKRQARLVEPHYYADTVSLLGAPDSDGSGGTICTLESAYYAEALQEQSAERRLLPFRTMDEALAALREGRCAALAGRTAALIRIRSERGDLGGYELIDAGLPPLPWAIAIHPEDAGSELERALSETVEEWHRSGKLKSLEQQWLGENTAWVLQEQAARQ